MGQGKSASTLVLTVNSQLLEMSIFEILTPNLVLKVLNQRTGTLFLINKVINRGKFLFVFPHSSPYGMSVLADSPWMRKCVLHNILEQCYGGPFAFP